MTDDLKHMQEAFQKEDPIVPDEQVKRIAISRAMAVFEEKTSRQTQGMGVADRLKDTATAVYEKLIGRRFMKLNPALAGGASFTVLVLAVLSANYVQTGLKSPVTKSGPVTQTSEVPPVSETKTVKPVGAREENRVARGTASKLQERSVTGPAEVKTKTETAQTGAAGNKPLSATARISGQTAPVMRKPAPFRPMAAYDASEGFAGGPARGHAAPSFGAAPSVAFTPGGAPAPMAMKRSASRQLAMRSPAARQLHDRVRTDTYRDQGRDTFETIPANPVKVVSEDPVSTFSIDVDTASYAFMRASLYNNVLPQKNAVRVEELINYFPYDYELPEAKTVPFRAATAVYPSPWNKANKIVHIGIKGFDIKPAEKPRSNLVFLLDTSGSMHAPNKLPLVKNSMKLLLETLSPEDTVAIVTYAGNAGTALEPTKVKDKGKILSALNSLTAAGSTAGAEGIRQAYELAQQNFSKGGVNRVILATDGDFNVGITNREELKSFVERKRKTGIFLSVLGFGMGNYNDALMQTLAQNGNGNAAYIDTLNEARKVLVEEASSMLFTIAKDVKIQVEFNPKMVAEYRLIGYETRLLNREDFANDKVDAGDIGSGHTVTVLYEITPAGSASRLVDDLRYQKKVSSPDSSGTGNEYAFLKIRYKQPDSDTSKLITTPVTRATEYKDMAAAPQEVRFATSVAAFGQLLRGGRYTGSYGYNDVISLAQSAKGKDEFGYRAEFINLVRLAKSASALEPLSSQRPASSLPGVRN